MNVQTIMDEADVRVPNAFSTAQKIDWLNEVNYEFYDIVKMPRTAPLTLDGVAAYQILPTDVREKNIRKVVVGSNYYRSMAYEEITAAYNYYIVDDSMHRLYLYPRPAAGQAIVVYDLMGTTPFTTSQLTDTPTAPDEYHWIYVLGLAVRIAKAMNDVVLANNFDNDYKGNLSIAQQNYLRG